MRHPLALFALLALAPVFARADEDDPEPPRRGNVVVMKTNQGTIEIELFAKEAPITVKNFLTYVDKKVYNDSVFHRVIAGFMIQGGGYKKGVANARDLEDLKMATFPPIKNESKNGLSNKRGTIAMARTNDPDSATAQFFINVVDNAQLDATNNGPGYCVFGKVVKGMDVVDRIKAVNTKRVGVHSDVPAEDVVIESVRRKR